jgi:hypothetical protein
MAIATAAIAGECIAQATPKDSSKKAATKRVAVALSDTRAVPEPR